MSTERFRIQILVEGFSHLLWLILLALYMLEIPPQEFLELLSKIKPGTVVLLGAIIIGASFFLGTLAENLLIALSYFFKKKTERKNTLNLPDDLSGVAWAWGVKSFFRSLAVSGAIIIVLILCLDNKYESSSHWWTIITIGIILESGTVACWLFLKYQIRDRENK